MPKDNYVHKLLDDLALADDRLQKEGFSAGLQAGQLSGYCEGYTLGLQHGTELSLEIGFYTGFVGVWQTLLTNGTSPTDIRKRKAVHKLTTLLEKFNFESISDDQLQMVRDQFKLVKAVLNVGAPRQEQHTF